MPTTYTLLPTESASDRFQRETRALRIFFTHLILVIVLWFIWLGFILFEPALTVPDLGNYVDLRTLDEGLLDLKNPQRRLIMVGDLHGMLHSLNNLLEKLQYNSTNDLLIHLGDLTAKGPHSNELVTRFARENIAGVRGNNDQKVIEWYAWFQWVKSNPGGAQWLDDVRKKGLTPKEAKDQKLYRSSRFRFPKDWEWNGDHYRVAQNLTKSDYAYLTSLPLVIHLPSLHTFMVHAGLLPMDPAHHLRSKRQPLAVAPALPPNATQFDIDAARYTQELALLTDIQPNTDPFIKLNLRDVHDLHPTRRGPKGHDDNIPWSDLWDDVIRKCHGFNVTEAESTRSDEQEHLTSADLLRRKPLPCYPITVVYSHASSRGLDLKKWSKGLDTGCVNGNGLTAMVLGKGRHQPLPVPRSPDEEEDDDERDIEVHFGAHHKARLVSVSCPVPPPIDDE